MADVEEKERKILVAVDEGEESMYALSWCLKNLISGNSKDTLILLYAKQPRVVYSALDGTGTNEQPEGNSVNCTDIRHIPSGYLFSSDILATMERYSNEVANSVLEKAKKLCREGNRNDVKVETRVQHGDARDVICQMAHDLAVDVLVIGSHGYGLIKRAFLGSVSNHCAQNVKCPVLIVKRPKPTADN